MKLLLITSMLAISLAGLAGCKTTQPQVQAPVALEDNSVPNLTIIYGTEPLARAVGITNAHVYKDGQLERFSGSIRNLTQNAFAVEYQVAWMDAQGAPLPNSPSWNRITLNPRAQKPITSISKGTDGVSAILTIKIPQDVEIFIPEPDPMELMRYQQEVAGRQAQQ